MGARLGADRVVHGGRARHLRLREPEDGIPERRTGRGALLRGQPSPCVQYPAPQGRLSADAATSAGTSLSAGASVSVSVGTSARSGTSARPGQWLSLADLQWLT